jgi:hypothetical protein
MYKDKDVYDTFDKLIKLLETMTKRMQETELKLKQLDDNMVWKDYDNRGKMSGDNPTGENDS